MCGCSSQSGLELIEPAITTIMQTLKSGVSSAHQHMYRVTCIGHISATSLPMAVGQIAYKAHAAMLNCHNKQLSVLSLLTNNAEH